MCLGIPGQIVEMHPQYEHLAKVDVSGVGRMINIGLLEDEHLVPGDWVLIHVGFAMSKIDEQEAHDTLAFLKELGEPFEQELQELRGSRIE